MCLSRSVGIGLQCQSAAISFRVRVFLSSWLTTISLTAEDIPGPKLAAALDLVPVLHEPGDGVAQANFQRRLRVVAEQFLGAINRRQPAAVVVPFAARSREQAGPVAYKLVDRPGQVADAWFPGWWQG